MDNFRASISGLLKKYYSYFVIASVGTLTLFYQNCGSPGFETRNRVDLQAKFDENSDKKTCSFDGSEVLSGASVIAFQNASPLSGQSCVREIRACTNGILSGSYNFPSCNASGASDCMFNGATVKNGTSVAAFAESTVKAGAQCARELRTCSNGMLSGSFQFASCSPGQTASCLFNGVQIPNGQSIVAFEGSTAASGSTCKQETRICTAGALSGSFTFATCNSTGLKSCLFNGKTIAHGQSVTAFDASSVAAGATCSQQARLCNDGVLSGSYAFEACVPGGQASCPFNGAAVVSGGTVKAFKTATVPSTGTCISEDRTCTNGILSGSFTFGTCVKETATVTCSAGTKTATSSDGTNSCVFTWNGPQPQGSALVATTNSAGTIAGTCQPNGEWQITSLVCPNKIVSSCSEGSVPKKLSPDGSNECSFSWPSAKVGESITGSATSGGSISGTCLSDGTWNYSFVCPNKTGATCTAGAITVPSPDNTNTCLLSWESGTQGQTITGTGTNGGSVTGACQSNGSWNYSFVCPNKTGGTCAGGGTNVLSPDSSNSCIFSWASGSAGQTITGTASGGGSISGTCQSNGNWNYTYACPNKTGATCIAGGLTVPSPDGSNSCYLSWASGSQGQNISGTGTNGGSASGTCQSNGTWVYSYTCPNKAGSTCGAGSVVVNSPDSSNSCVLSWGLGSQGQSISGTGTNGGTVSGYCQSTGVWDYSYVCPNKTGATCPAGSNTVPSPDNSNSCVLSWASGSQGQSITGTGTGGGSVSGTCLSTGNWSYTYTCPNKTGATCPAGSNTIASPDNSNSCVLSWASGSQGQSITGTATGGGSVSGTCQSTGIWSYTYVCPNKVGATCTGGSMNVNSPNNLKVCTMSWAPASAGQSATGTGTNGGTISAKCGTDGLWTNVVATCPN